MLKNNLDKLMNTIIIGLCVVMAICGIIFISSYKNASWNYYADVNDYIWYIGEKDYSGLPYVRYQRKHVASPQGDLKEYMAVAEYFKNTSYYKMYDKVGDVEKAEEYLAKMDENKKDIGDLYFTIVEINEELGVELD